MPVFRNSLRQMLELPLLRRELLESSRRQRTWIIRSAVALILCGLFLTAYGIRLNRVQAGSPELYGAGREIAVLVLSSGLFAILLIMPALACAAIAAERERQSLQLLLISRLDPWSLILEKFLALMLLPLTVLMMTGPLLGAAFALGGVSLGGIAAAIVAMLVTAILINSTGIMCSSLFQSAPIAFLSTFVLLLMLVAVPGILVDLGFLPSLNVMGQLTPLGQSPLDAFVLVAFQVLKGRQSLQLLLFTSLPPLALALLMNSVSRYAIVAWPLEAPLNDRTQRQVKEWLWQRWYRALERVGLRRQQSVPEDSARRAGNRLWDGAPGPSMRSPIGMREISRNEQAQWKAHLGYSVVIVIGSFWAKNTLQPWEFLMFGVTFQVFFLVLSMILLLAVTSSAIAAERQRQTLDLLLVIPMSNRQFLAEKLAASDRVAWRVLLPNSVLVLSRLILAPGRLQSGAEIGLYLLCATGHLLILLGLTRWITLWFTLRMKTPVAALQGSLVVLLAICGVPLLLTSVVVVLMQQSPLNVPAWYLSSPVAMFLANELHWLERVWGAEKALPAVLFSLTAYGLIGGILRWRVYAAVSSLLNRLDGTDLTG
ncbi:MAG: ABC transporter permease [Planctomycetia bacterium]